MDTEQPSSTSGYANPLDFNVMNVFSDHTEMASKGYCRLFKAQRYGRWYVLKGLQPQHADNPQYAAMLEKEFQTAVNLKHPNIVNTYGIETDAVAGRCIVMEYVEGRTLAEFLKESPSTARRRKVAMQLLDAMQYYHALQIVHRDLKPSNILVTRNGDNVKLIDFGLADTDDYAILKGPAYTRGYAAPEQTVPDGVIDCRTDIYVFGLVLRQLFPRRYAGIVRRCTQNAPARRYPDALSVQRAIVRADRLRVILPVVLAIAAIIIFLLLLPKNGTDTPLPEESPEPQRAVAQDIDTALEPIPVEIRSEKPVPSPAKPAAISISEDEAVRLTNRICDSMYNAFCHEVKKSKYRCTGLAGLLVSQYECRTQIQLYQLLARMPQLRNCDVNTRNNTWRRLFGISHSNTNKMTAIVESLQLPDCDDAGIEEKKKMKAETQKDFDLSIHYNELFISGKLWE